MGSRPHSGKLIEARAVCERCAWSVNAANAQALAAQHFDRLSHRVVVTVTNEITYGALSGPTSKEAKQGKFL